MPEDRRRDNPIRTQALYDKEKRDGWIIISMKNDWMRIFAFE